MTTYITLGSLPDIPKVPGFYRSPNGYLECINRRRSITAPIMQVNPSPYSSLECNGTELKQKNKLFDSPASQPKPKSAWSNTTIAQSTIPNFLKKIDEILRFKAYMEEPIYMKDKIDVAIIRVRVFTLTYYVADQTISIEEPRTKNSGLVQGIFMKRAKVNRPGNVDGEGVYQPCDLIIGEDLHVHGRRFRLVDADPRTRDWYQISLNYNQGDAIAIPDDGYKKERQRFDIPNRCENHSNSGGTAHEKGSYFRRDQKVLRFFCHYNDQRLKGDKRDYVLYYYLLDDTIEIKEVAAEGRQNFPNLLSRQKLPKDELKVVIPRIGLKDSSNILSWSELRCGDTVNIYGRHLLLMACDTSTIEWYAVRGIHQRTVTVGHEEADGHTDKLFSKMNMKDQDPYSLGLTLEPVANTMNQEAYDKFIKGDKKVCRFRGKLFGKYCKGNDENRDFVVNYFLADDTISVFEPQVRNSGNVGGLYLARGRYKKHIKDMDAEKNSSKKECKYRGLLDPLLEKGKLSRYIKPTDFLPGLVVTFEMPQSGNRLFSLRMFSHDECTEKLLADKSIFPHTSTHLAIERLAEIASSANVPVRSILKNIAEAGRHGRLLPLRDFAIGIGEVENEVCKKFPSLYSAYLPLTNLEIERIASDFLQESWGDAVIYDDFVDILVLASPRCAKLNELSSLNVNERMLRALHKLYIEGQDGFGCIRKVFRAHDKMNDGTVTPSEWIEILRTTKLNNVMTRQVADALFLEYDSNGNGTLDYNTLCNDILRINCDTLTVSNEPQHSAKRVGFQDNRPLTLRDCLHRENERLESADGNNAKRLHRAMISFCSAFARVNRKKMIRKHFLAFDTSNSGKITRNQFVDTVNFVAAEFFMDFDNKERDMLCNFFFPDKTSRVDYEQLLNVLYGRDVKNADYLLHCTINERKSHEEAFSIYDGARTRDFGGTLNLFEVDH